jgi:transcriptional regulator with XRE-family HTH domain
MSFSLLSSDAICNDLAARMRSRRLDRNLTLEGLARRSGVALGTLKKFERSGQISLVSFVRLVVASGDEAALEGLLRAPEFNSLDQVLETSGQPKRGRIT